MVIFIINVLPADGIFVQALGCAGPPCLRSTKSAGWDVRERIGTHDHGPPVPYGRCARHSATGECGYRCWCRVDHRDKLTDRKSEGRLCWVTAAQVLKLSS